MDARTSAAKALQRVLVAGQSLSEAFPVVCAQLGPKDRALAQTLVYGVLRWQRRLDAVANMLLDRPMKPKDADVRFLLLCGLYELMELRTPAHATVAATAEAARGLRKAWGVGLINALLRRFQREGEQLLEAVDREPGQRYAHPSWMLKRLRQAWPAQWEAVAAANNRHAPMTLRVNTRLAGRDTYLSELAAAGIDAVAHPVIEEAINLVRPLPVTRLPHFSEGWVSVQDAAAQLAAPLLDVPPGARVLDACAAPGGKACHTLERQPATQELVAVDVEPGRLERVRENLSRLGLEAVLVAGDAADPASWWDGRLFERILIDAPCSGSGVIRRHPDIKWLRRDSDIAVLAATQRRLLRALWPLLASGGKLVYATCSVFPEENEEQVAGFLIEQEDAAVVPIALPGLGVRLPCGLQILPGEQDLDGFYYACLSKR